MLFNLETDEVSLDGSVNALLEEGSTSCPLSSLTSGSSVLAFGFSPFDKETEDGLLDDVDVDVEVKVDVDVDVGITVSLEDVDDKSALEDSAVVWERMRVESVDALPMKRVGVAIIVEERVLVPVIVESTLDKLSFSESLFF